MLIAELLVALAAQAFADKKLTPNAWGQALKDAPNVSEAVHSFKDRIAKGEIPGVTNFGQLVQIIKEIVCD